jgi:hypothetical protein
MSFTKEDRNFRSGNGKTFPGGERYNGFADAVALAIKAEFGATPSTAKRVARLVSANERCVRNWLDAKNGPNGEHLIRLMRHSEIVTHSVLSLAGRATLYGGTDLVAIRGCLVELIAKIDELRAPE